MFSCSLVMSGCLDAYPPDREDLDYQIGDPDDLDDPGDDDFGELGQLASTLTEGFEAGVKPAYATGDVALVSGTWTFSDALVGDMASDVKTGTRSARLRNSGRLTMKFNRTSGAGTVTIKHASFGADTGGSWGLFASQNSGSTWSQVGSSRASTPGSFSLATFTVNVSGTVRLEVRKLDGGSNRINIDDVAITDFGGGGGGGGGGPGAGISPHTALGLPSPSSTSDPNSYLAVKSGYVLSYNASRKVPNWVSWEINPSYLGSAARQDDFRPDDTLPPSMAQAQLSDYSGSGYDRGHMCPSADRNKTTGANSQTFYLTNMVPQAGNNNQGPWAAMENDLRTIASGGKQLFVVSGGTFSAGSNTVGGGVVVPDATFKVVVVLDAGQAAGAVSSTTRVIGVLMPNENNQINRNTNWRTFRVSVDTIEAQTGQNFMSDVPAAVQAVIESRVDNQ